MYLLNKYCHKKLFLNFKDPAEDCHTLEWSQWSTCSESCSQGRQVNEKLFKVVCWQSIYNVRLCDVL